jgi:chromodomain-helicase-DNA-binding protein 1
LTAYTLTSSALAAFPTRKERSDSSDDDYGAKSHKKKKSARNSSAQATPDPYGDSDAAWRRGAAKKVVTYDEAQVDYGLESAEEEEEYYQAQEQAALGGAADEIDQVLAHSRDEDRLSDPADIPQENLVSYTLWKRLELIHQRFHIKWKGYSHIHNTDELYSFLKSYKGFKRVENYINKVWVVDQRFQGKDEEYKPTREEVEQYQIDKERIKDMHESYKVVERILNEKEERNEEGSLVTLFFCKWTSEYPVYRSRRMLADTIDLQYNECTWECRSSDDRAGLY